MQGREPDFARPLVVERCAKSGWGESPDSPNLPSQALEESRNQGKPCKKKKYTTNYIDMLTCQFQLKHPNGCNVQL